MLTYLKDLLTNILFYVVLLFISIPIMYLYINYQTNKRYEFQSNCKRIYFVAEQTKHSNYSGKVNFSYKYNLGNGDVLKSDTRHYSMLPCDTCKHFFISFCPVDTFTSWTLERDIAYDTAYKYGQIYDSIIVKN